MNGRIGKRTAHERDMPFVAERDDVQHGTFAAHEQLYARALEADRECDARGRITARDGRLRTNPRVLAHRVRR
jgi:hypothetical protein